MAQRVVAEHGSLVLVYDTEDVENFSVSAPYDVIDITKPDDRAVRRKLGQAHLNLSIDFKPGKCALWVDRSELEA